MIYRNQLFSTILLATLCVGPALAVTPWAAQEMAEAVTAGAWKQSETIYRELLSSDKNPDDLMPLNYNLAVSLLQQKQYEEAKGLFETVVKDSKSEPLRAQASYNLGNTLFALEKLDDAKKAFEESLLMNSDDDDARYNIEVILRKQKENEDKKKQQEQNKEDKNKDKDKNQDPSKNDQGSKDDKDEKEAPDDQGTPDDKKGQDKKEQGQDDKGQEKSGSQDGQQKPGQKEKSEQQKKDEQAAAGMSAAEKKAAQEAQEKARLLEYFRQQERDGRPDMRVQQQAPPPGGKTW